MYQPDGGGVTDCRAETGPVGWDGGGPGMRAREQAAKLAAGPVGWEPCGCETQSCKKWAPLLSLWLIPLSETYTLSCPLWTQACASWTLTNQSQMTKIMVVVDNIIAVLKLILWTSSLTHKLRLFLRSKMSLQMPEPRITGPENCKPETPWPSKLQIKKRHKMTINLSLLVLFLKKRPNSQTRLEWLVPRLHCLRTCNKLFCKHHPQQRKIPHEAMKVFRATTKNQCSLIN